jgi:hypothetical protein
MADEELIITLSLNDMMSAAVDNAKGKIDQLSDACQVAAKDGMGPVKDASAELIASFDGARSMTQNLATEAANLTAQEAAEAGSLGNINAQMKDVIGAMQEYVVVTTSAEDAIMNNTTAENAHTKSIREVMSEYKTANIEAIMCAQAVGQLGNQMKATSVTLADGDKSMDKWTIAQKDMTRALREQHPIFTSSIVTAMSYGSTIAQGISQVQQMSKAYDILKIALFGETVATEANNAAKTKNTAGIFANIAAKASHAGATIAESIANWAATASQWALNFAMYANPIIAIIMLIVALILAIVWLSHNMDGVSASFRNAGGSMNKWAGDFNKSMGDAGAAVSKWQRNNVTAITDSVKGFANWALGIREKALTWGKDMMIAFFDGMKKAILGGADALKNIGEQIKKFLGFSGPPTDGPLKDIPTWGKHLSESYVDGMNEGMKNKQVPTPDAKPGQDQLTQQFVTFFKNMGEMFKVWGKDLAEAFIKALVEEATRSGRALARIGESIKKWLGFSAPPPLGPLHDVPTWGEHAIQSYVGGMNKALGAVAINFPGGGRGNTTMNNDNRGINTTIHVNGAGMDADRLYQLFIQKISEDMA